MNLTPKQKDAAEAKGSLAVTAGAGTGKTRMLAERYLFHVREQGLSPLSVVAVTFTEKAAAELRSRIRSTLASKVADDRTIAEVEAAQISTIHALAARICRDFYYLAGISADFAVLDETDSPLWFGEKFAEAVAELGVEIVDTIGHRKLIWLLQELLKDPTAAERGFVRGPDEWPEILRHAKTLARKTLRESAEWNEAAHAVSECSGAGTDKLEEIRSALVPLLAPNTEDIDLDPLNELLKGFRINLGGARNWEPAVLHRLRRCIGNFKAKVNAAAEICALSLGHADEDLAERIPLLKMAFQQTREYIADQKIKDKVLDFNDLEHYALKVLDHDEARRFYRQRWKAFLIDEFQDTNAVQADIIGRLTEEAVVSIVGDEKQSIYGFRGADVEVFGKVRGEIVQKRGGADILLDRTFRAHRTLAETMNLVFAPVLGNLHQPLTAEGDETTHTPPFVRAAAVEAPTGSSEPGRRVLEARYIVDQIKILHEEGVPYSQIAILSRRWEPLNLYLDVLTAEGIPAVNAGGGNLLATIEARDIYSLLQFAADPYDDIALVSILRSPFFGFDDLTLYEASPGQWTDSSNWWDTIRSQPAFVVAVRTLEKILEISKLRSAETVVRYADRLTGFSAVIANLPQGQRRLADLEGVFDVIRKLALLGRGDVFGVVRYLRELYENDISLPRPAIDPGESVVLMTIHRAKGLEWPVVFVPDLSSASGGISPSILVDQELGVAFRTEDEDLSAKNEPVIYSLIKARRRTRELDEARRILYVAVTRAKDKVFLTAGKEKGYDIDILRPGLEAASVDVERIPYERDKTVAPAPGLPPEPKVPDVVDIDPIVLGPSELPVTALTVYASCPAQFKWEFIEKHPGVQDGSGSAMRVGTMAHLALEKAITTVEGLARFYSDAELDELERAISFANRFGGHVFEQVRQDDHGLEMAFVEDFGTLRLRGVVDRVGDDFVLDYKTDAEIEPAHHRFQLWAYAKALKKKRALIAYLANDHLYEFTADELAEIDVEAAELMDRISRGEFSATPSASVCQFCSYGEVCEFRFVETNEQVDL